MRILIATFACLFFVSCSVQKRHYMKGLYFEKHSTQKHEKSEGVTIKSFYKKENGSVTAEKKENPVITASAKADEAQALSVKEPEPVNPVVIFENCDTLFFRDGTVIAAKIIELNANEIKYRYCSGGETEVIRVVLKTSVEQIVYSNGLKESFKKPEPVIVQPTSNVPTNRKTSVPAVLGFIFSLLCYPVGIYGFLLLFAGLFTSGSLASFGILLFMIGIIMAIAAIILDVIGLVQTTSPSKHYKGLGFAIAGLALILLPIIILIFYK
ncbi:MAG: hypothetical protein ACXVPN_05205 [Bacteroidia bacterium]